MGRAVITGRGLISALGDSPAKLREAIAEGRTARHAVPALDGMAGLPWTECASIESFVEKTYLGIKNLRPLDRTARLVTCAAKLAIDDCGISKEALTEHEAGLILGTMFCGVRTIAEFDRRAITAGVAYASVMDFSNTVINAAAGQTAIWHGLRGLNATICGGVTSGLQALSYASNMIRMGRAKLLLAGGGEEFSFESLIAFGRAGWLGDGNGGNGNGDRGLLLGEGAALLMLEDAEFAAARGARVLGRIRGSAIGFDRSRGKDANESAASLARAITSALAEAGLAPSDISLIYTGKSGAAAPDAAEAEAIRRALGSHAPPQIAIKDSLGETVGAGGALQVIDALEATRSANISGNDELSGGSITLSTSMGLDGNCCAVLISM